MNQDRPLAHVSEDRRIHLLDEHLRGYQKDLPLSSVAPSGTAGGVVA